MIDLFDARRITGDCYIAINALKSIIESEAHLHPNYLKEKITTAQSCLDFIKTFCKEL